MTRMTAAAFRKYVDRDGGRCVHCGTTETLVPGHRQGRGMGGSKARETPSNVVTMCHWLNDVIERAPGNHPGIVEEAKANGWKLESWQDFRAVPVYDSTLGAWFLLDDDFQRIPSTAPSV